MNIYEFKKARLDLGSFSLRIGNFHLEKGNIYVITGQNGCGKTTLLNLFSFFEKPSEGTIAFRNKKIDYANQRTVLENRRKIGYLMQNPYLFNMSVYDNVAYGLSLRGFSKQDIRKKVNSILSRLSLAHLATRNVRCLSGGEFQRVALARILVLDVDIFLLDEPTANVDKNNVHIAEELILSFNKERNATIIVTTHFQEQAYRLSQNIFSIINGQINSFAYENIFSGTLKNEGSGLRSISLADNIQLKVSHAMKGYATLVVNPRDIILSTEKLKSSALNSFHGRIVKLEHVNDSLRVFVDAGVTFCVLITHRSFYNMRLNINKEVWVTFKANSVKVIQ